MKPRIRDGEYTIPVENNQTNTMSAPMPTYKVCILGNGESGKTAFVAHHMGYKEITKYTPTLGVEAHPLVLTTNYGKMCLNMWDCAGVERFGGLRDCYYTQAKGAFVFSSSMHPLPEYQKWGVDIHRVAPDAAILFVRSKADLGETASRAVSITRTRSESMVLPIQLMLRKLSGKHDLVIV
jgi:GTP-binding nuclear protein Ran